MPITESDNSVSRFQMAASDRRPVRLHLLVFLAWGVVACVVLVKQFEVKMLTGFGNGSWGTYGYERGWPLVFERGRIHWSGHIRFPWRRPFYYVGAKERYEVEKRSWFLAVVQSTIILLITSPGVYLIFQDHSLRSRMEVSMRGLAKFIALLAIVLTLFGREMLAVFGL